MGLTSNVTSLHNHVTKNVSTHFHISIEPFCISEMTTYHILMQYTLHRALERPAAVFRIFF